MTRGVALMVLVFACGSEERPPPPPEPEPEVPVVPVYEAGEVVREVPEEAVAEAPEALTTIDLRDDFAPRIFTPAPELGELGTPPYRGTYVALADERLDQLPEDVEPERFLEVFGIFPTFRVLAARLGNDEVHECHGAIDPAQLHELPYDIKYTTVDVAAERQRVRAYDRELPRFEAERERLGLGTLDALEGVTERDRVFAQFVKDRRRVETMRAVQAHLRCDGLLPAAAVDGVLDESTSDALAQWQRRAMLYAAGSLEATTLAAMRLDSRERDFRAVLRALRERVVDATGVIEDGSAAHAWGTILGRVVDAPELRDTAGHEARPNGAPDWISPATEAAAEALGWTSPEAFTTFAAEGLPEQVAVALPAVPAYHSAHVPLRVEVDRGDVDYELPREVRGARAEVERHPIVTLIAGQGNDEVALVQWPTTIGGWMRETVRGGVALKYKESPVGPRVWRDVVAAPAWIPPGNTPVNDLVRHVGRDRVVPNTTLFGPGYRSAYGLAMMIHHRREENPMGAGDPVFVDEGVRTHGSVAYRSILTGSSHGCHRLHNHLAVRTAGFLLAHRRHVRRGSLLVRHSRELRTANGPVTFRIRSRGYAYELTPPVEVEVLEGRIIGRRRTPDLRAHPVRPE
ncbi:MAG: hypothetical protein CMN30_10605 [Sandaracinus sp.]|nr:hypothetical protein [Sandaracinus sp.]